MQRLMRSLNAKSSTRYLSSGLFTSQISANALKAFAAVGFSGAAYYYFSSDESKSNHNLNEKSTQNRLDIRRFKDSNEFRLGKYIQDTIIAPLSSNLLRENRTYCINGNDVKSANFIADAVEIAMPALVHILQVSGVDFGFITQSGGSGFIIRTDDKYAYIVTNAHVVRPGGFYSRSESFPFSPRPTHPNSSQIKVTLSDGREFIGILHGKDDLSDIAIVKIEIPNGEKLPTMSVSKNEKIRAGEWAIALGSPHNLQNTVTAGIVSQPARHGFELGIGRTLYDYIQVDCSINSGSSGGPLINIQGEVIGINTIKAAGVDGIGFAIPMASAKKIVDELIEGRVSERPYLGVQLVNLNPTFMEHDARIRGIRSNYRRGILVTRVAEGSPADKAGLRQGDIIVMFNGKTVDDSKDLINAVVRDSVGKEFPMVVLRGEHREEIKITTKTEAIVM